MKKRWLFIPVIGILIVGIIVGSFLDLQINRAIYDEHNGFAMVLSAFGEIPSYGFMGCLAYGFAYLGLKEYKKSWQRVILFGIVILLAGFSIYFMGKHIFDENAYYTDKIGLKILGYGIGVLVFALGVVAGHFLISKHTCNIKTLLLILVTITVVLALANGVNQLVKIIMSRPRYRMLANMDREFDFRNWWENGRSLKTYYKTNFGVSSESFKSFPSGHLTNTMCIIYILPTIHLINNRVKINEYLGVGIAFVYCAILAFSRMLCGAHYLSDVCMGSLIAVVVALASNQVFLKLNAKVQPEMVENQ